MKSKSSGNRPAAAGLNNLSIGRKVPLVRRCLHFDTDDETNLSGYGPNQVNTVKQGILAVASAIGAGRAALKSTIAEALRLAAEKSKQLDDELVTVRTRYEDVVSMLEASGVTPEEDIRTADIWSDHSKKDVDEEFGERNEAYSVVTTTEEELNNNDEYTNHDVPTPTNVQQLIMRPEHFSRKDHWLRMVNCPKCGGCPDNKDMHCKSQRSRHNIIPTIPNRRKTLSTMVSPKGIDTSSSLTYDRALREVVTMRSRQQSRQSRHYNNTSSSQPIQQEEEEQGGDENVDPQHRGSGVRIGTDNNTSTGTTGTTKSSIRMRSRSYSPAGIAGPRLYSSSYASAASASAIAAAATASGTSAPAAVGDRRSMSVGTSSRRVRFSNHSSNSNSSSGSICRCNHGYHYYNNNSSSGMTQDAYSNSNNSSSSSSKQSTPAMSAASSRSGSPFGGPSVDLLGGGGRVPVTSAAAAAAAAARGGAAAAATGGAAWVVGRFSRDHYLNMHRSTRDNGLVTVSPWEGSQYRTVLLQSLKTKQLLKLVFSVLKFCWETKVLRRGISRSCGEFRRSQLLKHSFLCLLLESLATKFIVINSYHVSSALLLRKTLRPVMGLLNRARLLAQVYQRLKVISNDFRGRVSCRYGMSLLRWHCDIKKKNRWAEEHVREMRTARAFAGWIFAFIKRNAANVSLQRRLERAADEQQQASAKSSRGRAAATAGGGSGSSSTSVRSTITATMNAKSYFNFSSPTAKRHEEEEGDQFLVGEEDDDDDDDVMQKQLKTARAELLTNLFLRRKHSFKYHSKEVNSTHQHTPGAGVSLPTVPSPTTPIRSAVAMASRDTRSVKEGTKPPILGIDELRKRTVEQKEEEEEELGTRDVAIRQIFADATISAATTAATAAAGASSSLFVDTSMIMMDAADASTSSSPFHDKKGGSAMAAGGGGAAAASAAATANYHYDYMNNSAISGATAGGRSVKFNLLSSPQYSTTPGGNSPQQGSPQDFLSPLSTSSLDVSSATLTPLYKQRSHTASASFMSGDQDAQQHLGDSFQRTPFQAHDFEYNKNISSGLRTGRDTTSRSSSQSPASGRGRGTARSHTTFSQSRSRSQSPSVARSQSPAGRTGLPSYLTPTESSSRMHETSSFSRRPPLYTQGTSSRSPSPMRRSATAATAAAAATTFAASPGPARSSSSAASLLLLLTPGPTLATIDTPLTSSKITPGSRGKSRAAQTRDLDRAISSSKVRSGYVVASDEKTRSFTGSLLKESVKARRVLGVVGGGDVANKSTASSRAWALERDSVISRRKSQQQQQQSTVVAFGRSSSYSEGRSSRSCSPARGRRSIGATATAAAGVGIGAGGGGGARAGPAAVISRTLGPFRTSPKSKQQQQQLLQHSDSAAAAAVLLDGEDEDVVSRCSPSILERAQEIATHHRQQQQQQQQLNPSLSVSGGQRRPLSRQIEGELVATGGTIATGKGGAYSSNGGAYSSQQPSSPSDSDISSSSQISVDDDLEMATTRLVTRGLWCLRKLKNIARISKAFRHVRKSRPYHRLHQYFSSWKKAKTINDEEEAVLQQYDDVYHQRLLRIAVRQWERSVTQKKFGVQQAVVIRSRMRRIWRAWKRAKTIKHKNAPKAKWSLVLFKALARGRKRAAWNHWKRRCFLSTKLVSVEELGRKMGLREVVYSWSQKVANRMLLQRVFAHFEWAWSQRAARGASDYRLLCAVLDSWKETTQEIVFAKKSQAAVAFRDATLKASVFCAWADITAALKVCRATAIEEAKKNDRIFLRKHFLSWKDSFSDKIASVSRIVRALRKTTGLRTKTKIFGTWLKAVRYGYGSTYLMYRKALLRRGLREWRLFPRLQKLSQWNVSTRRLRTTSTVFLRWLFLWEDRIRIRKGNAIFQASWNRIVLRRAMLRWPGWKQFRAAEHMRGKAIRRQRGSSRLLYLIESAECEDRTKQIILQDRLKQREEQENPSFIVRRRPIRDLAERIAAMAVQTVCRGLDSVFVANAEHNQALQVGMYRTAAAAAARMLVADKAINWNASATDTAHAGGGGGERGGGGGDIATAMILPLMEYNNHVTTASITQQIQRKQQQQQLQQQQSQVGSGGSSGGGVGVDGLVPTQVLASADVLAQVQEQAKSNEELVVRLLLLLVRTVFKAWKRAIKAILSLRERERMVLRTYFERVRHRYLRHWVSRCTATAHRAISWIPKSLPRPHDKYVTKIEKQKSHREKLQRKAEAEAVAADDDAWNEMMVNNHLAAAATAAATGNSSTRNKIAVAAGGYSESDRLRAMETLKIKKSSSHLLNGGGGIFAGMDISERGLARKRKHEDHRNRLRHEGYMQIPPDWREMAADKRK